MVLPQRVEYSCDEGYGFARSEDRFASCNGKSGNFERIPECLVGKKSFQTQYINTLIIKIKWKKLLLYLSDCGVPPEISNTQLVVWGRISSEIYNGGTTAIFICKKSVFLPEDAETKYCVESGKWEPEGGACYTSNFIIKIIN